MGFRSVAWVLGFRAGLGFGVYCWVLENKGSGFTVGYFGTRVWGLLQGFGVEVWGLGSIEFAFGPRHTNNSCLNTCNRPNTFSLVVESPRL